MQTITLTQEQINNLLKDNSNKSARLEEVALDLSNSDLNAEELGKIVIKYPNLKGLNISGCDKISDLTNIPDDILAKLSSMDISGTSINHNALDDLFNRSPQLQVINVKNCVKIAEELHNITDVEQLKKQLKPLSLTQAVLIHEGVRDFLSTEDITNLRAVDKTIGQEIFHSSPLKKINVTSWDLFERLFASDTPDHYKKVIRKAKSIKFSGCDMINDDHMETISDNMPNLEEITIASCNEISHSPPFSKVPDGVKKMHIYSSKIPGQMLVNSLLNSANITELTMHNSIVVDLQSSHFPARSLSKLEIADIKYFRVGDLNTNEPQFTNLFLTSPHLKKLKFPVVYPESTFSKLPAGRLSQLEDFSTEDIDMSTSQFENLFSKAHKLKRLNVHFCGNIMEVNFSKLPAESLSQLEYFDGSFASMDATSFNNICSRALHLKELNLKRCKNLYNINISTLPEGCLSELEHFSLFPGTTEQNLTDIALRALHLKELIAYECPHIGDMDFSTMPEGCLSELETFEYASGTNPITGKHLTDLSLRAPHLKILKAKSCRDVQALDFATLPEGCLSELEVCHIPFSGATEAHLTDLSLRAPHLKELVISSPAHNENYDFDNLPPKAFSELEKFDACSSNLTQQGLAQILRRSPNLREVKLNHCKLISLELRNCKDIAQLRTLCNMSDLERNLEAWVQGATNEENRQEAMQRIMSASTMEQSSLDLSSPGLTSLPDAIGDLNTLKTIKLDNQSADSQSQDITREESRDDLAMPQSQASGANSSESNFYQVLERWLDNTAFATVEARKYVEREFKDAYENKKTALDFEHMNLTDLPDVFNSLSHLKSIKLEGNKLTCFPFEHLRELEELDLNYNQISELPDTIKHCEKLRKLDLSNNQISNLPDEINECEQLEELDISSNRLTTLPRGILNISSNGNIKWKTIQAQYNYLSPEKKDYLSTKLDEFEHEYHKVNLVLSGMKEKPLNNPSSPSAQQTKQTSNQL